jgi:hypothetical protein
MSKLRKPVIFQFEGLSFEVDVQKQVLRQTNEPAHEISFVTDMVDCSDYYHVSFDNKRKCVTKANIADEQIKTIFVPPLSVLDPEGMSRVYHIPLEELPGKTDFEIIVNQEALKHRYSGNLPRINIAGDEFLVDIALQELRHAINFYPAISLKSFELSDDGWKYEAFYHPVLKQVVELDPKLTGFPDGIIKIQIPNEIGLDPVGTARHYVMNEKQLLRRHPIQTELKAILIPLSETHIPSLIRQNREQLQKEHEENARKIRPRHRPKY